MANEILPSNDQPDIGKHNFLISDLRQRATYFALLYEFKVSYAKWKNLSPKQPRKICIHGGMQKSVTVAGSKNQSIEREVESPHLRGAKSTET